MTDHEIRDCSILELPRRLALSLIDPSAFLSSAGATQTAPIAQGSGATATSGGLLSDAMTKLNDADAAAASSPTGASARNVGSSGSTSFATVP